VSKLARTKTQTDDRIVIENRRRVALELRMSGLNYESVAEQVKTRFPQFENYNRQRAWDDINALLERTRTENQELAETAIQLELGRLDQLWSIAHATMMQGDLKAIDQLLKVSAARCNLLGINAPIQLRIDQSVEAELSGMMEALRTQLSPENYRQVIQILAAKTNTVSE
jgi:hypothetical protein